jgi:predicted transcriptional regulator
MTAEDHEKLYEVLTTRLTRQAKMMWVLLVSAFGVGGWATIQQQNIANLYEKMAVINTEIKAVNAKQEDIFKAMAEMKEKSFTFREAQAITERLAVLEVKFVNLTAVLDEKIDRLEEVIQKQVSTLPDSPTSDPIAAQ